jgi:hypothetical protein
MRSLSLSSLKYGGSDASRQSVHQIGDQASRSRLDVVTDLCVDRLRRRLDLLGARDQPVSVAHDPCADLQTGDEKPVHAKWRWLGALIAASLVLTLVLA